MALTNAEKRKIEDEERLRTQTIKPTQKHSLPALLSFFIPGLGQLIKGQVGKGILILIGVIFGLVLFVIPGVILWIWQIADAYNN